MALSIPLLFAFDLQAQTIAPYTGLFSGVSSSFLNQLPEFYQGNVKDIGVIGVLQSGSANGSAFSQANLTGYTMEVTISATPPLGNGSQVVYMAAVALANNAQAATQFTGQLDFTQSNLNTAMAALPSIQATIEFELIFNGFRQTIYQGVITIFAPADNGAVFSPSPPTNYYTAAQTNAKFFQINSQAPGGGFFLTSPDGATVKFISLANDGTLSVQ